MKEIKLKRAYELAEASDGFRVYVDRLWPRGLSHETFKYDLWDKAIAPSTELREWYHANPEQLWSEFEERYTVELLANPALDELTEAVKGHDTVTLLFSSHDTEHNNAVVLRNVLLAKEK